MKYKTGYIIKNYGRFVSCIGELTFIEDAFFEYDDTKPILFKTKDDLEETLDYLKSEKTNIMDYTLEVAEVLYNHSNFKFMDIDIARNQIKRAKEKYTKATREEVK